MTDKAELEATARRADAEWRRFHRESMIGNPDFTQCGFCGADSEAGCKLCEAERRK
jgi:hypothetical protein